MCVLSLLFVAAAASLLPRGGGGFEKEEDYFAAAVWRLSPLIGGYLLVWTAAVSWSTAARAAVLVRVAFLLLLADATGAVGMFLGTVYTAAVLGYAVADAPPPPPLRHRRGAAGSEAERAHRESSKRCLLSLIVAGTAAFTGIVTMMMLPEFPPPVGLVVFDAAVFSGPYFLCLVSSVNGTLLRGELVADGAKSAMAVTGLGMWWVIFPVIAGVVLHSLVVALFVYWLTGLAMAGVLGYTLAVYDHYNE
uniref:Uncharacterized protein n=1 Tax=Oryza barthii TaxID=65489 RepID=A0A0D3HIV6_9ORYZ